MSSTYCSISGTGCKTFRILLSKFADILIMNKETKTYLSRAVDTLKANPNPLIPPAVIGVLFYIPTNSDQKLGSIYFLPMIVLFVIMPLIYGQYIEIISNNRKLPYVQIFNTHWFNFFVVSLCLVIPILIFIMGGVFLGLPVLGLSQILSIVIDILSIYILPLVFLLRKRFSCIPLGVKCLVGNFKFSRPLIFLAMVPTILHLLNVQPADATAASLPFLFLKAKINTPGRVYSKLIGMLFLLKTKRSLQNPT